MKSRRAVAIILALAAIVAGESRVRGRTPPPQAQGRDLELFLFAGQSNMAGSDALVAGTGDRDMAAAGLQTEADRRTLFTFGSSFAETPERYYPWGDIRGHLGTSFGKLGFYIHGPEVGFARTLYAAGLRDIAIVKVANNFREYEDGRSPWVKPHSFYRDWRAFIGRRLDELRARGHRPRVVGFAWIQGVDDGGRHRDQTSYEADLRQIIADLRADYGSSRTPFVLARSVDSVVAGHENMVPIRAGQVAVATADPMADWVDVDDLGPWVRWHHMISASQLKVGERLGRAYLNLVDPKRRNGAKLH